MPSTGGKRPPVRTGRHRRILEISFQKLVMHRVSLISRENAKDEARKLGGSVEILRVCAQNDLFAALPAEKSERSGADGLRAERRALSLDKVSRHDLGVTDCDDSDKRHDGFAECHLNDVPVERDEARYRLRAPFSEVGRASDVQEEFRGAGMCHRVEDASERVDDIVRSDLAPVVELHAFPEIERPREPIPRGSPELSQCRFDRQGLVELDQAIEDLL